MNPMVERVASDLVKSLDGPTLWELSTRAEQAGMSVAAYMIASAKGQKPRKPQARKRRTATPARRSAAQAEEARLIRAGVSSDAARVLAVEVSRRKR